VPALSDLPSEASERYLILIDLSDYTGFLAGVERTHGEDFSAGLVDLAEAAGVSVTTWVGPPPGPEGWPTVSLAGPTPSARATST